MKFLVTTLGCKVNQFESDAIAQALQTHGWHAVQAGEHADVCIVNTCTVTGKASMQSRQVIRQLMRRHEGARIIVTGCYAQTAPEEIEKIGGVHYVIGHFDKSDIPRLIVESLPNDRAPAVRMVKNIQQAARFSMPPAAAYGRRTRPYLKIQDGCNCFCTYCIVPHARGPSRSMPFEAVLEQLKHLGRKNFREVVLTGIHLGAYGADLTPPTRLIDLLYRIETLRPLDRLRLSSIEPDEVSPELVAFLADSAVFCPHFHLPLQSGDDRILERMHRPYDGRYFMRTVRSIHDRMPHAAIGADVLVGFPGEDQASFDRTYDLIADLPLTYLHVFPFSARPGTPACHFPDRVSDPTVKARTARLRVLGQQKGQAFMQANIDRTHDILVENRRDGRTGLLTGVSANYLTILFEGDDRLMNHIVPVRASTVHSDKRLMGHIIEHVNIK
ncbi:MAG: tRNA (N(6)-L-threonylcarbamoyladenosine(37)-C(2))-methylthiotransferase MtaB [Desulfosarcina sp.]|nr:tRNA (N(6)-L-threonylcarbamoyladenosine(37)-C(2))-methylthiotransferase MtaB [Desulfobacterales bacterium]